MLPPQLPRTSPGLWQRGNPEFPAILNIASGSASELEYHFLLARDLGFLTIWITAD